MYLRKFAAIALMKVAVILALAITIVSVMCLNASSAEKVLTISFDASDLKTLDPHMAATTQDRAAVDMIFNGLVRYKPGDISKIEPDLAKSIPEPKILPNGKQEWVFELKKGVMVHPFKGYPNGYELKAEDVVYSLKRATNPKISAYAGEYKGMEFEAIGDYKVRITLEKPISPALFLPKVADYAGGFIVPKKAVEKLGNDAFKTNPVGTGPFMFKNYKPMESVELVANRRYFRGKPGLDKVVIKYMPDISSREMALRKGEVDVAEGLREQVWVEKIRKLENISPLIFGPGETVTIHLNIAEGPFKNEKIRKAVCYALNRDEFVEFFGTPAEPLYSPVPAKYLPGGLTRDEVAEKGLEYRFNPEKAKRLLEEAGVGRGFSVELVTSERASYRRTYESIQAQLRKVGIDLKLRVVDHSTMHSMIRKDVNPLVVYICWRPNADVFLTRFYHSDSIVVTGKSPDTNFSHYDRIDELIEKARIETNLDRQAQLWKEAQERILEDAAAYPLFILGFVFGCNERVDWGYEIKSTLALYPQITEKTSVK